MRKTLYVLVVVTALILGIVAYASAAEDVIVTASVNNAFTMSTPADVNFGAKDVGFSYTDNSTVITVKSNKDWDFSKGEVVDALLDPVLAESTDVAVGTVARGVTPVTVTYTLDLTLDEAYALDAGTPYSGTFTYTALQL